MKNAKEEEKRSEKKKKSWLHDIKNESGATFSPKLSLTRTDIFIKRGFNWYFSHNSNFLFFSSANSSFVTWIVNCELDELCFIIDFYSLYSILSLLSFCGYLARRNIELHLSLTESTGKNINHEHFMDFATKWQIFLENMTFVCVYLRFKQWLEWLGANFDNELHCVLHFYKACQQEPSKRIKVFFL